MGDGLAAPGLHPPERAHVARWVSLLQLLERRQVMDWLSQHARPVMDSILYSVLGTFVLLAAFVFIERVLPFSLRKELAEDQNVALGIILGAFILGVSIIISSAIRG
jgi:putative membrane protein